MYKGVERDEARQAAKRAAREADLQANRQREAQYQKVQPTPGYVAHSVVEEAEKGARGLKERANKFLEKGAGVGDREDRAYITGRWGVNGKYESAGASVSASRLMTFFTLGLIHTLLQFDRNCRSANRRCSSYSAVPCFGSQERHIRLQAASASKVSDHCAGGRETAVVLCLSCIVERLKR